jgi:hypothetical protein
MSCECGSQKSSGDTMFSVTAVSQLRVKEPRHQRRLILIDIENVVGGAFRSRTQANWARQEVERMIGPQADDQVVIATGKSGLFPTRGAWPSARLQLGKGINGADLKLLEVMAGENVHERFAKIVLISGDGIFAEQVSLLAARGVHVTVVAHASGLSRRLKIAASEVKTFAHKYEELGEVA